MACYVDQTRRHRLNQGVVCHLFADTTEELLAMAAQVGLAASELRWPGERREHFELGGGWQRRAAIAAGALELNASGLERLIRRKTLARRKLE